MRQEMREDISSLVSSMLHTNTSFFSDVEMDESFLRGFMAGLVQSIMIERAHGEVIGRLSHAEFVELYDAACAFLMESSV
jgi:hypothetical protein